MQSIWMLKGTFSTFSYLDLDLAIEADSPNPLPFFFISKRALTFDWP